MKISFHTKFKDKIHIVDIRGLKRALETQSNQLQLIPNQKKGNIQINKIPGINKISQFKRSYTDTSQNLNNQNKSNRRVRKQMTEQSDQKSERIGSKKYSRQKSALKYTLSMKKQDEMYQLQKATLNRNPEVENLVYKLREKQKQKYQKIAGPKYIDEMIIKHENLFRMLDHKRQKKQINSTAKDIQKFQKEQSHHKVPKQLDQMQSSLIDQMGRENMGLSEPNSPTHIKLKKIQEIIMKTHENRLKQKQRSQRQKSEVSRNSQYSFLNENSMQSKIIKGKNSQNSNRGVWSYENSLRSYEPSGLDTLDSVHSVNINSNGNYIAAGNKRNLHENSHSPFPKIKKPWSNIYSK